jgi:hypothetical protein
MAGLAARHGPNGNDVLGEAQGVLDAQLTLADARS